MRNTIISNNSSSNIFSSRCTVCLLTIMVWETPTRLLHHRMSHLSGQPSQRTSYLETLSTLQNWNHQNPLLAELVASEIVGGFASFSSHYFGQLLSWFASSFPFSIFGLFFVIYIIFMGFWLQIWVCALYGIGIMYILCRKRKENPKRNGRPPCGLDWIYEICFLSLLEPCFSSFSFSFWFIVTDSVVKVLVTNLWIVRRMQTWKLW